MTVTFKESVWITNPANVASFDLNDPDSVRDYTYRTTLDSDMTSHNWIRVGTSETLVTVEASFAGIRQVAAQQCDDKIRELQAEVEVKINALLQLKSELLCIEGPSND